MFQISNKMFTAGKLFATAAGIAVAGSASYATVKLAMSAINRRCSPEWKMEDKTINIISTTAAVVGAAAGCMLTNLFILVMND
jgi:hypothetical protein